MMTWDDEGADFYTVTMLVIKDNGKVKSVSVDALLADMPVVFFVGDIPGSSSFSDGDLVKLIVKPKKTGMGENNRSGVHEPDEDDCADINDN